MRLVSRVDLACNHRLRIHRCATRYTSPMISLSHRLRHIHTHFWQVHSFEFQYKCITEKCILPFYKRPGQKHNFTCCLKYAGQLPFINTVSANQGNLVESFLKIAVYLTFPYLIPYKILHLYSPEMSVRMTYPSHPRTTRNTPSCTSMYP